MGESEQIPKNILNLIFASKDISVESEIANELQLDNNLLSALIEEDGVVILDNQILKEIESITKYLTVEKNDFEETDNDEFDYSQVFNFLSNQRLIPKNEDSTFEK